VLIAHTRRTWQSGISTKNIEGGMFIGGFISLILLIWMTARIWNESAALAIVSFFFWPALIFALFRFWADEESDIKLPFVLFVAASVYAWHDVVETAKALREQPETLLGVLQYFC
jgi:hypothetical protein